MFAERTNWDLEPNRLSDALEKHRAAGKPLLDLTVSNPTVCGFEYDRQTILHALGNPAALIYEPDPKGLICAREAVSAYYAERGESVSPQDILLTTSTSEAYSFVFRLLCNAGDEILVPAPSYPLFGFLADVQDVRVVRYPLFYDHGWHVDFHALQEAITPRTRGVVVVHPNNPTGNFCKLHEMEQLSEICAEREIAIIADEVFLDFPLGESSAQAQLRSFATNKRALTFTLSGLSKICGLPQMKVAWLVVSGSERLKRESLARLEVIADTYLSMNAPVQLAAPTLLAQRHSFQKQLISRANSNLAGIDSQLKNNLFCKRLEIEGGWYIVLKIHTMRSEADLAKELLEVKNVYVHPGHFFDFSAEPYLVLSVIAQPHDFLSGVQQLLSIVPDTGI